MSRTARRHVVQFLFFLILGNPCHPPLSRGQEVQELRSLADEIGAAIGDFSRTPPLFLTSVVPDSVVLAWQQSLAGMAFPDGPLSDWLLREILIEALDQARGFSTCHGFLLEPEVPWTVGPECYKAWVRSFLGEPLDPDSIYALSVHARLEFQEELRKICWPLLGTRSLRISRQILAEDPRFSFQSPEEVIPSLEAALQEAKHRLVRVFPSTTDTPVLEVKEMPVPRSGSYTSLARYVPGGGGAPPTLFVDVTQWSAWPKGMAVILAFHEGWPGHHYYASFPKKIPPLHPVLAGLQAVGVSEGWAMYAESLGRELGLLDDFDTEIAFLFRMVDAALVAQVDAGIHAFGWSREQAIDTLMAVGGRDRDTAELHLAQQGETPGRMVSHFMGYSGIRALREEVRTSCGVEYDPSEFHRAMLEVGPLPLSAIRAYLTKYQPRRKEGGLDSSEALGRETQGT